MTNETSPPLDRARLESEIRDLSPWHIDVEVAEGIRTGAVMNTDRSQTGAVSLVNTETSFKNMIQSVYPQGLSGRRFLDVACNCGAYSLWARDLGADECVGFDAREHWIAQAEFLRRHRPNDQDALNFELGDVMELGSQDLGTFDVSYFGGILYHLPLPLTALKEVADITTEVLYLNTASMRSFHRQGLAMNHESTTPAMSGIHGLNWYPTSPAVMIAVLEHLGFVEFHMLFNRRIIQFNRQRGIKAYLRGIVKGTGRFALLASKQHGLLTARPIVGGDRLKTAR